MTFPMQRQYNFSEFPNRCGTGSLKWQRYENRDVLPMWVADMDFTSPVEIREALHQRVEHGVYGYTLPYPGVEEAVIDYMQRAHAVTVKRDWIVWMPGLVPALNTASRAFEKPGDSVLTNTPVYPPFLTAPEWQNKELLAVPLKIENGRYTFDFPAMEAAVNERTRLFILCNPHNPVGRCWNQAELRQLVDFCRRHNLIVVSDEIHCDLVLDPQARHQTFLSLDEWAYDHSLTLMAPSKTYNVPGLSCAFIIIPNPDLRLPFQRASRGMITEVSCMGYTGCEAAYRHGEPWRQELISVLRENFAFVRETVTRRMPRIHLYPLEATYLAWMDVRGLGLEAPDRYFEDHGVGLSNGALFGAPGYLRLNFACPRTMLETALDRMVTAYQACP